MPTVLRVGLYRLYFLSHDLVHEPPPVHIDRDEQSAKFWLREVGLARNLGFGANELRKIERIIVEHQGDLMEKWKHEYGIASR